MCLRDPFKTLSDATLALLLSARTHGTDAAVRVTAKRCVKLLPRRKRDLLYKVVESRNPLELVAFLARELEL
ncbi:DUF7740 domain-containing protein [Pseudomonas nitroreducens]|uniref:DUF7740 domain-containing protein n=1 Tax=Pseudomonas nitroreducens TaxID=46680 RepID=UPI0009A93A69|nr:MULTISPECIES: hypothetical protein [Pseudomonas aeruginosa group]